MEGWIGVRCGKWRDREGEYLTPFATANETLTVWCDTRALNRTCVSWGTIMELFVKDDLRLLEGLDRVYRFEKCDWTWLLFGGTKLNEG